MLKPYSVDLRERVFRYADEGHSCRAAAAHFGVSVSLVVNLVKAFRMRGSLAPKPVAGAPTLPPRALRSPGSMPRWSARSPKRSARAATSILSLACGAFLDGRERPRRNG